MSRDLQCLDSTPIDSPKLWSFLQQPFDSPVNHALTAVAQEVAGLLQQAYPVQADGINHTGTIAIRAIEPEYRQIITTEPLAERELEVLQLIVDGYSNSAISEELYISDSSTPLWSCLLKGRIKSEEISLFLFIKVFT